MDTKKYVKDNNGIWVTSTDSSFSYSDGVAVENRILDHLEQAEDISLASDELQSKIVDWPSEYHFSPVRTNLLSPFLTNKDLRILEIGSGCGAITRLLGEKEGSVTALEASYQRARITAERCRDLDKIEVVADTFENFSSSIKYDLITMIGVLEYSPCSYSGPTPVLSTLKKAYELLVENSILIIAIENQLGLKYFNGGTEDHTGEMFYGINDRYSQDEATTFGKKELERLLDEAGFDQSEFVYPFPDYKLPQLLIRDEATRIPDLKIGELIGQYSARDYSGRGQHLFLEKRIWPVLARNDLVPDLANSFLVFASKGKGCLDNLTSKWLVKTFSGRRKKRFLTENSFVNVDNRRHVDKRLCYPEVTNPNVDSPLIHHIGIEDHLSGKLYREHNAKVLFNKDNLFESYVYYLSPWIQYLKDQVEQDPVVSSDADRNLIHGNYYDCIPSNIIYSETNQIRLFDQEWEYSDHIPLDFLIFRGVIDDLFRDWTWYISSNLFDGRTFVEFFSELFNAFSIYFEKNRLCEYIQWDGYIQQTVSGQDTFPAHLQKIQDFLDLPLTSYPGVAELLVSGEISSLEHKVGALEQARIELTEGLDRLLKEREEMAERIPQIHDIMAGPSWKIGRAVTYFPRKARKLILNPKQVLNKLLQRIPSPVLFFFSGDFFSSLRKGGVSELVRQSIDYSQDYHRWYRYYASLSDKDRQGIVEHIASFSHKPVISILIPTYNTPEKWLKKVIESVLNQLYPHWELCLADDASTEPHVRNILEAYSQNDERIKLCFRAENGHISAATNSALELATGDFIALVDHDDELTEDALYHVALEINRYPDTQMVYTDEDKIDSYGRLSDPYFKPNWNPDLLLSHNCITHLGVYRRDVVNQLNGLQIGYEGAQDWDLALRFSEIVDSRTIRHIPRILYHWRTIEGSTALTIDSKSYAIDAGKRAVESALSRTGKKAEVIFDPSVLACQVKYQLKTKPLVSIIIPTRDRIDLLRTCIDSILNNTDYPDYEIIIVDNDSETPEAIEYFEQITLKRNIRIVNYSGPFNFSAINNRAVCEARGEVLVLMNNDIEAISSGWLYELVSHALRAEVGVAGARLLYPDNTVQHAGLILGLVGGVAGVAHKGLESKNPGRNGRSRVIQDLSAVTAACFAVRKQIFEEIGGFNETDLKVAYNDVDFCLRVREKGYRVLYTPYAELYHHESVSRGYEDTLEKQERFGKEQAYMKKRWGSLLLSDPFYNPNLTLENEAFSLAFPPRIEKPWLLECLKRDN